MTETVEMITIMSPGGEPNVVAVLSAWVVKVRALDDLMRG